MVPYSKSISSNIKACLLSTTPFAACLLLHSISDMLPTRNLSSVPHLPIGIDLNVIGVISNLKTESEIRCRRRKFISTQDEEIRERKVLRHQNMVKRQGRLEELAHSDPEYAKALDIKECMLEVQGMLLGKLAAEENHFRGLAVLPSFSLTDFDERISEIEEVIQALQY